MHLLIVIDGLEVIKKIMNKLLIATTNPGKLTEYKELLKDYDLELLSLTDVGIIDDVDETATTFEGNAIQKVDFFFERAQMPTMADDGGLEIDALNGEPGVKSRRWPGHRAEDQELMDYALERMKDVPEGKRTAKLVASLAIKTATDTPAQTFRGELLGSISTEPVGDLVPGYPFRNIFFITELDKMYADMSWEDEVAVGHRKKAVEQAAALLHTIE